METHYRLEEWTPAGRIGGSRGYWSFIRTGIPPEELPEARDLLAKHRACGRQVRLVKVVESVVE